MLEQKKISSKINYDVLRDLNSKGGSTPKHEKSEQEISTTESKLSHRKSAIKTIPLNTNKRYCTLLITFVECVDRWWSTAFSNFFKGSCDALIVAYILSAAVIITTMKCN